MLLDDQGMEKVLHSLESYGFLKILKYNNVVFHCQREDKQEITVEEEYNDQDNYYTKFD